MKSILTLTLIALAFGMPASAAVPVTVKTTSWGVNTFLACQQAVGSGVASGTKQCVAHGMDLQSYTVMSMTVLDLFHCSATVTVSCQ